VPVAVSERLLVRLLAMVAGVFQRGSPVAAASSAPAQFSTACDAPPAGDPLYAAETPLTIDLLTCPGIRRDVQHQPLSTG
jgi:hypothetical protein